MKNTSTKNSKAITLSIKDFYKHMLNGSLGHQLSIGTARSYLSQIRKVISIYGESEKGFLKLDPTEFSTLILLINEQQKAHKAFSSSAFNMLTSATKCYRNYLELKYFGIIINKKNTQKVTLIKSCDNTRCKSLLWKILNAFGLLKYI